MLPDFLPAAAFGAGIVSILSPCVLPLLPVVFAYSTEKGRMRPLAIILGLSLSFTFMGIITSAFGATFRSYEYLLRVIAEVLILTMGSAMLFDLNLFNFFGNFSSLAQNREKSGVFGGFLLGMSLGVVWIPCVGPFLGSILTMVAVEGDIAYGGLMLFIYSMGFALPMLLLAYSANVSSARLRDVSQYGKVLKKIASFVIIGVGLWMVYSNHFA